MERVKFILNKPINLEGDGDMEETLQLRINELARKKKEVGLTIQEQEEQASLYRLYIDEMKEAVKKSLHDAGIEPKNKQS